MSDSNSKSNSKLSKKHNMKTRKDGNIKDSDIDIIDLISENNKHFSIILTKVDKCPLNYINTQKESLLSL